MLLSLCVMRKWNMVKVDAEAYFPQAGAAQREVHVISSFESDDKRRFLWLLQAAT